MNKYEQYYKRTEGKNNKKEARGLVLPYIKLDRKLISKGININKNIDSIGYCLLNLIKFDDDFIEWFKKSIIEKYDKTFIYFMYMEALNYVTCPIKNDEIEYCPIDLDTCMKSFVKSGLVKNVEFLVKNLLDKFEITMPNNEKIVFSRATNSQKDAQNASGYCHAYSEALMQEDILHNTSACCGCYKDMLGYEHYHTFVVSGDIVYDFSNNIKMLFSDYIKIFNFKILLQEEKYILFSKIKYLSETDPDFDKSTKNNILKVTMNELMNKQSKIK